MTAPARAPSRHPLLRILQQCPQRRLLLALASSVAGGAAGVAMIALVNAALTGDGDPRILAASFAGCAIITAAARTASGMLFANLGEGALLDIRTLMASRIVGAPYRRIEELGASKVHSVITDDAAKVAEFLVAAPHIVMNAVMVAGCLLYLAWFSLTSFALAAVVTIAGSVIFHLGNARALKNLEDAGRAQDELFTHFEGLFSGAKELKLNEARARAFLDHSLKNSVEDVRRLRLRGLRTFVLATSAALFLVYVLVGVLTFWTGAAAAGSTIVFLYLMMPLDSLLATLPQAQQARVSMERIERVLAAVDEPELRAGSADRASFRELRLEAVRHSYFREAEDGAFTLGPIDLTLKPGEVVMLIGGNGSGKTTLAKVLTGLYSPESGAIILDGQRVEAQGRSRQRALFSAVFSDFHLFPTLDGLSRENSAELDARANALIAKLHLSSKVTSVNGVLSTRALSQGQRKRLALVIAYLEDRPFYVFDEWAADQDPVFRDVFYRTLLPELRMRGKAVLAISHDDRYFGLADRCVKLENGAVAEVILPRASAESALA
jgi:putative ATP-binding cassette transporter